MYNMKVFKGIHNMYMFNHLPAVPKYSILWDFFKLFFKNANRE